MSEEEICEGKHSKTRRSGDVKKGFKPDAFEMRPDGLNRGALFRLCGSILVNLVSTTGNKCRIAHCREELFLRLVNHPKYRKNDYLTYNTNELCKYGARCHLRHNESLLLESLPRFFFELPRGHGEEALSHRNGSIKSRRRLL